ncbi:MAG TPA: hypothetical protein VGK32_17515 [Vicinamibacterales bacterium]|jgi:photosystem II stability/assembly factor-like uncharacterized protein
MQLDFLAPTSTGRWVLGLAVAICWSVWQGPAVVHSQPQAVAGSAYSPSSFTALAWRNIGPNLGGRSLTIAGSPNRPNEYYFGAVGGGLWKTTDGGNSWTPVTDRRIRSSSVGAVGVSESNPDIVYLGTGEVQLRGNIMQGDGMYKSLDAGMTWTHIGLPDTQAIGRVRVHPTNPDIVYVAALGHPYGPNEERGVFKTTDGGKTWQQVLSRGPRAGAVDLCIDPNDPVTLYAGFWEVYRTPWTLASGGPGSGLFKTADGGATWTELTRNPGLPQGIVGKIGVAVSRADSKRVYTLIDALDGGLFRSDDAGATWTKVNQHHDLRQRAFYFTRLVADPKDRDTVYVLNYEFQKSTDGGKTFKPIPTGNGDNHDLWIDPNDPRRLANADDGGGTISVNGGRTFTRQAYPTAQMYHVSTTKDFPYHVCGGQQDRGTNCVPSDFGLKYHSPRDKSGDWFYSVGGNESGFVAPHPTDPDIFYAGGQEGTLTRYDRKTGQERNIKPYPYYYSGQSAGSMKERWQWTFPIVASPVNPQILYASSQHLWRTTNEGQSWEKISPDLTRADPKTLGDSGGPITKDQNGPEVYATIYTIASSRHDVNLIWTGSDDGLVHVTRDAGKSWAKVTPPDMPEFTRVSMIDASPHQPGTAYVAGMRYQLDDRAPYAWKTHDYGRTWTKIVNGIRGDDFVHAVREDPRRQGLLYAATEHGVYVSLDDGTQWLPLSLNLPDLQVSDLVVENRDLVIATHGRGFYVLDDIEPLRQLTPEVSQATAWLFTPAAAVRRVYAADIDYVLRAPAANLKVEILDGSGATILTLPSAKANHAGLNRLTWDLRYPGATVFDGMILRSAAPQRGPIAPPGTYQVRLTADGQVQTRRFTVTLPPQVKGVSQADLEAQFALGLQIRDKTSAANQAVILIRDLKKQIADRQGKTTDRKVVVAAGSLVEKLAAIEEELYQVRNQAPKDPLAYPVKLNNRIPALGYVVDGADARPTDQSHLVFKELSAELDAQLGRLDALLKNDVPVLNRLLGVGKLPPVARSGAQR